MKNFSIHDLERYSGIKAHTLRTWELRYGVPKPQRNRCNSRFYSLNEVKEIMTLALLNKNGYRISYLSKLTKSELESKIQLLKSDDDQYQMAINGLIIGYHAMEIEIFESILDECFLAWPHNIVIGDIIYPFLKKTGLLWEGKRLSEEHLVVTAIRKKLLWAIQKAEPSGTKNKVVLLFLPGTKQLDLGLLHTNYVLKTYGVQVVYLGSDVTISNLQSIFEKVKPHFIYTYIPENLKFPFPALTSTMKSAAPGAKLIVTVQPKLKPLPYQDESLMVMDYDAAISFLAM